MDHREKREKLVQQEIMDNLELLDHEVCQVKEEDLERPGHLDHLDLMEPLDKLDHRESWDPLDQEVSQEVQEQRGKVDPLVQEGQKDPKVNVENLEHRGPQVQLELTAIQEHQVPQELRVQRVQQVSAELLVYQDHKDHLDHKEASDRPGKKETRVCLVLLGTRETRDLKDQRVLWGLKVCKEFREKKERGVNVENQGPKALPDQLAAEVHQVIVVSLEQMVRLDQREQEESVEDPVEVDLKDHRET